MKNFIQVTRADGRELHLRTSDIWSVGDSQISGFTAISVKDRHWRVEQSVSEVLGKIAASERPSVLGPLPVTATEITPGGETAVADVEKMTRQQVKEEAFRRVLKETLDTPRDPMHCGGLDSLRNLLEWWMDNGDRDCANMAEPDLMDIAKILGVE